MLTDGYNLPAKKVIHIVGPVVSGRLTENLKKALETLSVDEREIVLLKVLGGYKSHEIADILDCPSSTVRSKYKRSLDKLRNALGGEI